MQIVFLDDDEDLRQTVVEVFGITHGTKCLAFSTLAELATCAKAVLTARLAILDINLGEGQPSGLDAYHWLRESGFEGKIVFLTGHARSHPLVSQARQAGKVVILEKPTTMERLLSMLE